ncbi:MAG: 4-(cytidine 5'-diphospho)-2-C-methyl-D-erythritol kinase [Rubrobacteraceae bacterium]
MERLRLRAFAKINYALEVCGLREDGYHDISTVMQSVSLADEVELERADRGLDLIVEPTGAKIGPPEDNTVYRAWKMLRTLSGRELPVKVRLHKKIPAGAGLGGGSADAAAFLLGMNELHDLGFDLASLREIGDHIGADVPFCLSGGTALAGGTGDVLTSLPSPPSHHLVLIKPSVSADTGKVYRAYDALHAENILSTGPVVDALRSVDLSTLARAVGNSLSLATRRLLPEIEEYEQALLRAGALGAMMSGSGSAVYGIFTSKSEAEKARSTMQAPFVEVCEPVDRGVETL